MLLVIDANIILSALVKGDSSDLILSPKINLVAPELLFTEIKKHESEILFKSVLSDPEFEILSTLMENKIKLIPMDEFIQYIPQAEKLFKEIGKVKSLTTSEVRALIEDNN